MYGTQAGLFHIQSIRLFENDVKMYGTQASATGDYGASSFENDVKMYGTQANALMALPTERLRMM